ncbi:MAG: hypothetical protein K0S42_3073 [Microvirga sp.]|jgi:hypothetical protein|nr:hypothetical protein [Microvirga sp.]
MPRKRSNGDKSAMLAIVRQVANEQLQEFGRTQSLAVATAAKDRAPDLFLRVAATLAFDDLIAVSRKILKESTGDTEAAIEQYELAGIPPVVREGLPRSVAVPNERCEDGISFVVLTKTSDTELDAAIDYLQQKIAQDSRRVNALIAYRRWRSAAA